jgi:hypothetical protein
MLHVSGIIISKPILNVKTNNFVFYKGGPGVLYLKSRGYTMHGALSDRSGPHVERMAQYPAEQQKKKKPLFREAFALHWTLPDDEMGRRIIAR